MNLKDLFVPSIGGNNHERRKLWVEEELKKIRKGSRILDAGAGTQQFKKYCLHLTYISQDFASYIPSEQNEGLQNEEWNYGELDIISDITNIPQPDESFDVILCSEVLEHLPDPNAAIAEFSRLLKRGGILLITAPFCSLTHQAPYFFSTGFSPFYYKRWLESYNFSEVELTANGSYFQYLAQEAKRLNGVSKKYCNRNLSFYQKIVITLFLRILNKKEKQDSNSKELLCFGYFVKAVKK